MSQDKKAQTLSLLANGKTVAEIAKELEISQPTIYKWKREADGSPAVTQTSTKSLNLDTNIEVELLRAELDFTKRQLEIYKRALSSRDSSN